MSPLAPFFSEYAYQVLRPLHADFDNASQAVDAVGAFGFVCSVLEFCLVWLGLHK